MKKLYLVDLDTHVIMPREPAILQLKALDATRTMLTDRQVYRAIINTAPPVQPVTCESCGKDDYCDRSVSYDGFNLDIGGCDQWGPKK